MSAATRSCVVALVATLLLPRPAAAVEGGVLDRSSTFAVSIVAGGPSSPAMRCSGTLVSPNVVLTVRHCVGPPASAAGDCAAEFGPPAGRLWVGTSPWVQPGSGWHEVSRVVVPETRKACGDDVALLVLDAPVPEGVAKPARVAVTRDAFREAVRSRTLAVSGFGAVDGSGASIGTRRVRGDIPVGCVPGEAGYTCGPELDVIDALEFTAGSGPCSGDSGAGAFTLDASPVVFGVLSRGKLEGSCSEGVFERTDVWAWLIAKTIVDAAPGGIAPDWASSLFPAAPGEGDLCRDAAACGSHAECASSDGRRSWRCFTKCASDGACATGRQCESGLCVATKATTITAEDGCAVGVARPPDVALAAPFVLGLLCRRRWIAGKKWRRR